MYYRIKVPLSGSKPEGGRYIPFALTSRDSEVPIENFVRIPLPSVSDSLPQTLFRDPSAPLDPRAWEEGDVPLMHWRLSFFRHNSGPGQFTCIGVTFPHVVFDGMGIASVVHALEAESLSRPWSVSPTHLVPGDNENPFQAILDELENPKRRLDHDELGEVEYHNISVVGPWFVLSYIMWHIWQSIWHGTQSRIVLVPAAVYEKLVDDARQAAVLHGLGDVRLSTGDVLAAWLFKASFLTILYSSPDLY